MKILKFRISTNDISKQILVSNNDSILGLVCSVLSAINNHKCVNFELRLNDKIINLENKMLRSKLESINFKNINSLVLISEIEIINITFLESKYVTNETFCNYPALDESNKTARTFSDNYYFRLLYWDLKFGYTKLLNKRVTN